jgi:hypothetical protein
MDGILGQSGLGFGQYTVWGLGRGNLGGSSSCGSLGVVGVHDDEQDDSYSQAVKIENETGWMKQYK